MGRIIYEMHSDLTGDTWWRMAKRTHISADVMQRFLALREHKKAHNGRALANAEAIFEAMGHKVMPVPLVLQTTVQQLIDGHYTRLQTQIPHKDTHGSTTHA